MDGIIKVSPRILVNTASEFGRQGTAINNLAEEMINLITSLASTWEGEAATSYINKFKSLEDDVQKMVRMVREHGTDLEEMARIYIEADTANVEDAGGLSSDIIV